jgi:DNA-binding NarL/FixJ family response regulator
MSKRARVPTATPRLPAPPGLEGQRFVADGSEFALLSFPLAESGPAVERHPDTLTAAEHAVMKLVVGGMSDLDIARARGTSARTVGSQISAIYRKLGVRGRRELRARFAPPPPSA